MHQDTNFVPTLDRLDIRWSVEIEAKCTGAYGTMTVKAVMSITLGTYDGEITREIMADNINQRGIWEGDVIEVIGMNVPLNVGGVALATKKVTPEDIKSMTIECVILDEKPIATSYK